MKMNLEAKNANGREELPLRKRRQLLSHADSSCVTNLQAHLTFDKQGVGLGFG